MRSSPVVASVGKVDTCPASFDAGTSPVPSMSFASLSSADDSSVRPGVSDGGCILSI